MEAEDGSQLEEDHGCYCISEESHVSRPGAEIDEGLIDVQPGDHGGKRRANHRTTQDGLYDLHTRV